MSVKLTGAHVNVHGQLQLVSALCWDLGSHDIVLITHVIVVDKVISIAFQRNVSSNTSI